MADANRARLVLRGLRKPDFEAVVSLQQRCFPAIDPWTREQFESQLAIFPEGQLGVEIDGTLVAASSSLIVDEEDFGSYHTFNEVADHGFIRNHDPEGDTLYGIDIVVDPGHRGERLARRIYEARKDLAQRRNLRAIMIAGRIPGYGRHADKMSAEEYVRRVVRKDLKDPVLTSQLAQGFAIREVLRGYLPQDVESAGYAVFMEWLNSEHHPEAAPAAIRRVGVAAVQYQMRPITSFDEFAQQCEFFIDTASEYRMDFLLFPEMVTNQLQSLVPAPEAAATARRLDEFTLRYIDFFIRMAMKYNLNIIGGSHLTVENDRLFNVASLFRRDGSVEKQYKLHISPSELRWWGVTAGDEVRVFDTDRGRIAILIGDDVEFPETARIAAGKGAGLLFVPFNTDLRSAYLRVRSCAQARCIENSMYAVLSGPVGNLPMVQGADIHYGESCILTPCDVHFARDGVAEEATANVETMVIHELDMEVLRRNRLTGTTRTWIDRRTDLYAVRWNDGGKPREV
ncbi:MAG TPA: bifunctional GNAT family N-acetyltransferase/carbon-nitrogen hydrolase family protein [Kofleriaceae bacterium]|nr:bifunctional GNAT family N-acetyltransferase/carbon-nitrogen hydrolase family protein [Kofleriaceae bacterium]